MASTGIFYTCIRVDNLGYFKFFNYAYCKFFSYIIYILLCDIIRIATRIRLLFAYINLSILCLYLLVRKSLYDWAL